MKQILTFFKSVKLAVTLILYIAVTSILATIIPQGHEISFYKDQYPPLLADLIIGTQFHIFFRSILFLLPSLLFFVNLTVCAVDRLIRELTGKARLRIGVALVHLGILVLIVGGIVSFNGRKEGFRYMGEGDELTLSGDRVLRLESFEFVQYPDGRPKDWISVVDVEKSGQVLIDSFPIEVNRPLSVGSLKIYQSSYGQELRLVLIDALEQEFIVPPGQFIKSGDSVFRYSHTDRMPGTDRYRITFEKWEGHNVTELVNRALTEKIGDYSITNVLSVDVTGLQFVVDPGYLPVVISLILITIGLSWTYIQKIGGKRA
jgi:cytochrome c biogenesis protein